MHRSKKSVVEKRAAYSTLTGFFLTTFGLFSWYMKRTGKDMRVEPFELVQLGFASYRLGRLVAYDKIFETYRAPFAKTVPDPTGAGMTTEPRGSGVRRAIGELVTCPICSGTWVSAILVYGLGILPGPTRAFLAIMGAIGMAELLNAATEALQWYGQKAREEAGNEERERNGQNHAYGSKHPNGNHPEAKASTAELSPLRLLDRR